jgi:hypothetical protein
MSLLSRLTGAKTLWYVGSQSRESRPLSFLSIMGNIERLQKEGHHPGLLRRAVRDTAVGLASLIMSDGTGARHTGNLSDFVKHQREAHEKTVKKAARLDAIHQTLASADRRIEAEDEKLLAFAHEAGYFSKAWPVFYHEREIKKAVSAHYTQHWLAAATLRGKIGIEARRTDDGTLNPFAHELNMDFEDEAFMRAMVLLHEATHCELTMSGVLFQHPELDAKTNALLGQTWFHPDPITPNPAMTLLDEMVSDGTAMMTLLHMAQFDDRALASASNYIKARTLVTEGMDVGVDRAYPALQALTRLSHNTENFLGWLLKNHQDWKAISPTGLRQKVRESASQYALLYFQNTRFSVSDQGRNSLVSLWREMRSASAEHPVDTQSVQTVLLRQIGIEIQRHIHTDAGQDQPVRFMHLPEVEVIVNNMDLLNPLIEQSRENYPECWEALALFAQSGISGADPDESIWLFESLTQHLGTKILESFSANMKHHHRPDPAATLTMALRTTRSTLTRTLADPSSPLTPGKPEVAKSSPAP